MTEQQSRQLDDVLIDLFLTLYQPTSRKSAKWRHFKHFKTARASILAITAQEAAEGSE